MKKTFDFQRAVEVLNSTMGNTVYSPVSFNQIMAMLAYGAGKELQGSLASIGFDMNVKPGTGMHNSLWFDNRLNGDAAYVETLGRLFEAYVQSMHFDSNALELAQEINAVTAEKTAGIIPELMPEAQLIKVLKNSYALYLNTVLHSAKWDVPFDKKLTHERVFHGKTEARMTSFMQSTQQVVRFRLGEYPATVLGIYNETGAMIVAMPEADNTLENLL